MPESLTRGEIIGRNIHALRESKLLSKADIAERSGISWAGVDNVERGVSDSPRRKTIEPIAEVLGVTVEDLMREDLTSPKALAPPDSSEWHPGGAAEEVAHGGTPVLLPVPGLRDVLRRVEVGELSAEDALRELQAS